jgi:hypothetical protein
MTSDSRRDRAATGRRSGTDSKHSDRRQAEKRQPERRSAGAVVKQEVQQVIEGLAANHRLHRHAQQSGSTGAGTLGGPGNFGGGKLDDDTSR